jgi:hypothetical protein
MLGLVTDKLSNCAIFLEENNGNDKSSIVQIFFLVCFQARVSSMWARCTEIRTSLADKSKQHV